jgi:hypothetical protein
MFGHRLPTRAAAFRHASSLQSLSCSAYQLWDFSEKTVICDKESMEHGEDSSMTEDNIWEVCEVLYNKDSSREWIEQYVGLYPEGRYVKKANKLVS